MSRAIAHIAERINLRGSDRIPAVYTVYSQPTEGWMPAAIYLCKEDAPTFLQPGLYLGRTEEEVKDRLDVLSGRIEEHWEAHVNAALWWEDPGLSLRRNAHHCRNTHAIWVENQVSPAQRDALREPTAPNIWHRMQCRGYIAPEVTVEQIAVALSLPYPGPEDAPTVTAEEILTGRRARYYAQYAPDLVEVSHAA